MLTQTKLLIGGLVAGIGSLCVIGVVIAGLLFFQVTRHEEEKSQREQWRKKAVQEIDEQIKKNKAEMRRLLEEQREYEEKHKSPR